MKYGFVILHYNTIEETKCCVESITHLYSNEDFHIVIVDNASPNGTGKQIETIYKADARITVIKGKKNLGFARGNNVGCKWFVDNLHVDFIIVTNSDVVYLQPTFFKLIERAYEETSFDVLGPDIIDITGKSHQNPRRTRALSYKELWKALFIQRLMLHVYKDRGLYEVGFKLLRALRKLLINPKKETAISNSKEIEFKYCYDCVLYGACYIFSKKYYLTRECVFSPETFLYYEEDFLRFTIDKEKRISVLDKRLQVMHKVNGTTSTLYDDDRKRNIFKLTEAIRSGDILLEKMKEAKKSK